MQLSLLLITNGEWIIGEHSACTLCISVFTHDIKNIKKNSISKIDQNKISYNIMLWLSYCSMCCSILTLYLQNNESLNCNYNVVNKKIIIAYSVRLNDPRIINHVIVLLDGYREWIVAKILQEEISLVYLKFQGIKFLTLKNVEVFGLFTS